MSFLNKISKAHAGPLNSYLEITCTHMNPLCLSVQNLRSRGKSPNMYFSNAISDTRSNLRGCFSALTRLFHQNKNHQPAPRLEWLKKAWGKFHTRCPGSVSSAVSGMVPFIWPYCARHELHCPPPPLPGAPAGAC